MKEIKFSPPYGDKLKFELLHANVFKLRVSVPLRG